MEEECISKSPTWQDLPCVHVPNIQLQFFQHSSKLTQDNGYYEVCAAQTWMWRATVPVTVGGLYTLHLHKLVHRSWQTLTAIMLQVQSDDTGTTHVHVVYSYNRHIWTCHDAHSSSLGVWSTYVVFIHMHQHLPRPVDLTAHHTSLQTP